MLWSDIDERIIETAEVDERVTLWDDHEYIWLDDEYRPEDEVPTLY